MKRTELINESLRHLWTTQQVADMFNVTRMTIHNWSNFGGLPAVRLQKHKVTSFAFVPEDVLAWAKRNDQKIYSMPSLRTKSAA